MIKKLFTLATLALVISSISFLSKPASVYADDETTFWKYQCIDTMKISRDNARSWANKPDLTDHISWEMQTIKSLGANCVAIDTPYDAEFLPYLKSWIAGARKENLHIWFRGNFSGWEGWFEYPKITTTQEELTKLDTFIRANPNLFQDGDIFTGVPEAENGGPIKNITNGDYSSYRAFLVDEYRLEKKAFNDIQKAVEVDWFSMSGGWAERMYDKQTVDQTGGLVTIDHYISDPASMSAMVDQMNTTLGAKVMIGEFGAPVPDLNGPMTEEQQASFVDAVLQQLYNERVNVIGINYWDLLGGSTALMNPDQTPRAVADVIKKYFSPAVVTGKVTDEKGEGIPNVTVTTANGDVTVKTGANGTYSFPTLSSQLTIFAHVEDSIASASVDDIKPGNTYEKDIVLTTPSVSLFQQIEEFCRKIFTSPKK